MDKIMAKTRMRPNQVCAAKELSQLSETSPTAGPKYNEAQIAITRAMIMSMIGIEDVV